MSAPEPKVHEIEHEGFKAKIREPRGREAVMFARAIREAAGGSTDEVVVTEDLAIAILEWLPKLVVEPADAKGNDDRCWDVYLSLGRMAGPLPQTVFDMVSATFVIPLDKMENLPFRHREGTGAASGDADAS